MSTADFLGKYNAKDDEEDEDHEEGSDEDEGKGVDLMGEHTGDEDSSEEDDDDSEEEREVAKGFIEDEDESRRRKKKRRKHRGGEDSSRKRKKEKDSDDDAGDLDEDDLALLEENTGLKLGGRSSSGHKLKRLRRARSASNDSDASPQTGLNNIFDDDEERNVDMDTGNLFDADEMAGFIEDDTASESSGRHGSDSEEDSDDRQKRKAKKKQKQKSKAKPQKRRGGFGLAGVEGITAEAWQEVTDVFGNGQDYADALEDDSDEKGDKELKDIFEPSEIADRMLTEADEVIRGFDIPERMQLASVGLPPLTADDNGIVQFIPETDLDDATAWMAQRVSTRCTEHFLSKNMHGNFPPLHNEFLVAVRHAVSFLNLEFFEVPFIWRYRSDFLVHSDPDDAVRNTVFLNQAELWRLSTLSIKYRALSHRRKELRALFEQLQVGDEYFEDIFGALESVEEVADLQEWVTLKYADRMDEVKARKLAEEDHEGVTRVKKASRETVYRKAKKNLVSKLAERIGISPKDLALDFIAQTKAHYPDDPVTEPLVFADEYVEPEGKDYPDAAAALEAAKMILVTEISRDPLIKKEARKFYKDYGVVSVRPTEKGLTKIDEMNPYYAFKYLEQKPVSALGRSQQFLQILAAEAEGLVTSKITLPERAHEKLLSDLKKVYLSDYTSPVVEQWNELRTSILNGAIKDLLHAADSWVRGSIVEEAQDHIGRLCAARLDQRINVAPFCRNDETMSRGDVPSVLAISHGQGDPKRDSVVAVFLDSEGHFREHSKFDRLSADALYGEPADRVAFVELLRRRRPQLIVLGGFSANTRRLMDDVRAIADEVSRSIVDEGDDTDVDADEPLSMDQREQRAYFNIIFNYDDTARIYQNSKRANAEFPELAQLGKYCVALARYAQSPLNEYAALGADLTAITYDQHQKLLSPEKINQYLERTLVEIVNKVGVDINRAMRDSYYYNLLPYVSGLGPRKAAALVKMINSVGGGVLSSRSQLPLKGLLTQQIIKNAAAFLRIPQDDLAADLKRGNDDDDRGDILDDTRIHPEDYDIARKMASDAMDYDEEDIPEDAHPSQAVADVMGDDNPRKLDELSLDDFANELRKLLSNPKRLALYSMRDEMQAPFGETRPDFIVPTPMEVFTMLTGETRATLEHGFIIPVRVVRVRKDNAILVRLDSGVDGIIPAEHISDMGSINVAAKGRPGSTLQGLVMDIRLDAFEVELSTQESVIAKGDADRRQVATDEFYSKRDAQDDKEALQAGSKKGSTAQRRRVIQHPNFYNFNASEAELHLSHLPPGSAVIRPSSRDLSLAVTWKIHDGIYQHFAVLEMERATEFSLGTRLKVDKYTYSDLDELLESHVKAMSKKVEEMVRHEKFKNDQAALNTYLANFTMANPGKSAYGFTFASQDKMNQDKSTRDATFVLSFRRNHQDTEPTSWPIRVVPGSFLFLGEEHGSVLQVANAFKISYAAKMNNRDPNSVRTPFPAGGRTPMVGGRTPMPGRTPLPGGRTPIVAGGRTPVPSSRTPNPYANNYPPAGAPPPGYPPAGKGWNTGPQQGYANQAGYN